MKETSIKCVGIKKSYGYGDNRIEALKGIDLELQSGQLTLLVGPSGSGKSTLISIISSILTPDEGHLFLLGHEVSKMVEIERAHFCSRNLGIVFQSLFLVPTLTVLENVTLPLIVAGVEEEAANAKAIPILERMHLANRRNTSPANLSKGQQQRVAIGRAMINDSSILVCDEPTSALDQTTGLEIMSFLHELALHSDRTVLVVTHDHRIFPHADRIVNISDGLITSGEE